MNAFLFTEVAFQLSILHLNYGARRARSSAITSGLMQILHLNWLRYDRGLLVIVLE